MYSSLTHPLFSCDRCIYVMQIPHQNSALVFYLYFNDTTFSSNWETPSKKKVPGLSIPLLADHLAWELKSIFM